MTEPAFHHPVASRWQACLNAVDAPPVREQRDVPHGALVRARWVWERDGEEWLDGRVMSVWERRGFEDVVLVHRLHRDPRGQTHGEWLRASDVARVLEPTERSQARTSVPNMEGGRPVGRRPTG